MIRPLFSLPEQSANAASLAFGTEDHWRLGQTVPMPRTDESELCGGESVIDFALCLILSVAIVSLLLLALF